MQSAIPNWIQNFVEKVGHTIRGLSVSGSSTEPSGPVLTPVVYNWIDWISAKSWIVELLVVVVLLFLLNLLLKRMLLRPKKKGELKESDWRFHLDYAAITPARVLLWILLIAFALDILAREFKLAGFSYVPPLRNAAVIFCLSWFMLRWKRVFHRVALARPSHDPRGRLRVDPFTIEMVGRIFTILVIFITLLIMMSIFGLNIAPLIAFGGIGAASLGIAGKDVIANFFSGFMLYLTRPFTIGDQIELQQRKILGHVEEIGWYFTSIRDLQKKPIYIPNAVFSTEPLMNLSRMTHRRMEETIAVRYEDLEKIPKMLEEIRAVVEKHEEVDRHLPICVFLEKFGDTALQIEIKVYFLCTRYEAYMQVKQELLADIYRVIQNAGVTVPYPTMQVRIQQGC